MLAIGGMYEMLIPFLVLLGSIIPPIGGVILADYWFARGGRYPLLQNARLPRFNWLDSAPTPPARWWPIFRRGSRRWWGSPSPRWSISP
ncbi:cytosine/purine/uracil/thiamine/allantoin permease family protein [Klebsiella pneumoniae]|uniref:Cytosine/purine/uracil/thiamine/allantoin permease family protein n=1 Tax=Klebsiella pneumoniae TaxID=573 RepID=A0A3S4GSM6_KLEPN|nr:cytosine/purine/uracil/thiamine/allantoin permease family protein [Klebsiella pneumoniae]